MQQVNFIFGLGIFLFGMSQLEYSISKLGDARLRIWLRSSTNTPLASISTGIISTALLQSSSMVSLLVLAFASAGLLPLVNAIGIIVGANLGTTLTGWLVALLGFKLDLAAAALPLFGLAAFALALTKRQTRFHYISGIVLGFALLLFGLGIMKSSMETIPDLWDITVLQGHNGFVYLLAGVLIAALVQSSSAVMIMALAAVDAQIIALTEAAALIIGADLGTTSTTVLASITGNTIKRKLAFAHFIFNFFVDFAAFFLLLPILPAMLAFASISDPLYSLVAFHSLINVLGVAAFLPFMQHFSNWIERVFSRQEFQSNNLLDRVAPDVADAALTALNTTVKLITLQAICNSLRIFSLKPEQLKILNSASAELRENVTHQNFDEGYEELKNQEGIVLNYSLRIQAQALQTSDVEELERLHSITRSVVFSNKSLKDVQQDLEELKLSSRQSMRNLYNSHKEFQKTSYEKILALLIGDHSVDYILEELTDLQRANDRHGEEVNRFVYTNADNDNTDGASISIQLNANREIRHALKTMIKAIVLLIEPAPLTVAAHNASTPIIGA